MSYKKRVAFETLREIAFGSITANYQAIGSATNNPIRIVRMGNGTDKDVYVSLDGTTNHIRLSANSFFLPDLSANKIRDDGLFLAIGTYFYVKHAGVAPGSGNVWFECIYAE